MEVSNKERCELIAEKLMELVRGKDFGEMEHDYESYGDYYEYVEGLQPVVCCNCNKIINANDDKSAWELSSLDNTTCYYNVPDYTENAMPVIKELLKHRDKNNNELCIELFRNEDDFYVCCIKIGNYLDLRCTGKTPDIATINCAYEYLKSEVGDDT